MSSRAIRKLRGETSLIPLVPAGEKNHEDENSSDDDEPPTRSSARLFLLDDDDGEDSDSSRDSGDESSNASVERQAIENVPTEPETDNNEMEQLPKVLPEPLRAAEAEKEEDLDAILSEFQAKDTQLERPEETQSGKSRGYFSILLEGMDARDLDFDLSTRTSLMGGPAGVPRKNRQSHLFGPPRDGWTRPPHYVGGGIGMTSYDRDPRPLPWPYCYPDLVPDEETRHPKQWYSFIHSDTYSRDLMDYRTIQSSGDIHALVLFVAHHPFVAEALLQLSDILYQTNHGQEGLSLLRRCLWVLECSALLAFSRDLDGSSHLDYDQPENASFFEALFRLIRASSNAGLPRTALSSCRLLLSLDPLRDPMGTLLMMDHFALASCRTEIDHWLIRLVDSGCLQVWYRDPHDEGQVFSCGLLELPNWAYSYALALYRVALENDTAKTEFMDRASEAIQNAVSRFPNLVGMLIQDNDVDTLGRSFRRDWLEVLDYVSYREQTLQCAWSSANRGMDNIVLVATLQAVDLIGKIFVKQNGKLWGDGGVLQWLYDNVDNLKSRDLDVPSKPHPGIMRYSACNPADFDHQIELLPPDANVMDPNLVAHAMVVDPNRRRFLRRQVRNGRDEEVDDDVAPWIPVGNRLLAGPPTNVLDPDWPILEIFLRSFLPWNRVEGVHPPPR